MEVPQEHNQQKEIRRECFYVESCCNKKVGLCLEQLMPKNPEQQDLFHQHSDDALQKKDKLMNVLDAINQKYGRHTIKLAVEGQSKPWAHHAVFSTCQQVRRHRGMSNKQTCCEYGFEFI